MCTLTTVKWNKKHRKENILVRTVNSVHCAWNVLSTRDGMSVARYVCVGVHSFFTQFLSIRTLVWSRREWWTALVLVDMIVLREKLLRLTSAPSHMWTALNMCREFECVRMRVRNDKFCTKMWLTLPKTIQFEMHNLFVLSVINSVFDFLFSYSIRLQTKEVPNHCINSKLKWVNGTLIMKQYLKRQTTRNAKLNQLPWKHRRQQQPISLMVSS